MRTRRYLGRLALVAALAIGGCADPYNAGAPERAHPRASHARGPALPPYLQDAPDEGDRAAVRRAERRPAFQHLPYSDRHIAVDYTDERRGRIWLVVIHWGSRRAARVAYRRFLARYGDRPSNYLARFVRAPRP